MLIDEYNYCCCFVHYGSKLNKKLIKNELKNNIIKLIDSYAIINFYFHLRNNFDIECYKIIKEFCNKNYYTHINFIYVTDNIIEYCNLVKNGIIINNLEFDNCEFLPVNKKIFYNFNLPFETNLMQACEYVFIISEIENTDNLINYTQSILKTDKFRYDIFKQSCIIKKTQLDLCLLE